jgi:hypothetical protein
VGRITKWRKRRGDGEDIEFCGYGVGERGMGWMIGRWAEIAMLYEN